eukprot:2109472-Prymnesium_polylepis.1
MESDSDDSEDPTEDDDEERPSPVPLEILPRRDESGRFQAESPELRALRWAQEARGVAPST